MADVFKSLELLFDRPNEPLIIPKGEDNALFQLNDELLGIVHYIREREASDCIVEDGLKPEPQARALIIRGNASSFQYKPEAYAQDGLELNNRFGEDPDVGQRIPLKSLSVKPHFPLASQLPVDSDFSLFLPRHQAMVDEVVDRLMAVPANELQDFLSTCVYARGNLNPQLFNYCYSVALLHRNDTKGVEIPNFAEIFPSKFMDSTVFSQARQTAGIVPKGERRPPVIIPRNFTASNLEIEHRLAYFREDIGVNLHHWHWHLIYPFRATSGNMQLVNKDRRGELFYYMHQQIIARYNCERLCNFLKRVKKFSNWREPIPEAYFPKLDSLTSSRGWPPRQANMRWQDMNRPVDGVNITVSDMERWRRNVEDAIATGHAVLPNGTRTPLNINMLGNMVEASVLSVNPDLYGALHNNGHNFTSYIHDPNHLYLESFAVMADEATTMRDPFFYRWHAFIDDVFQKYKESANVRAYTTSELTNPGVQVASISVQPNAAAGRQNELNTYWMASDVNLSRGLDFSNRGPVYARFTHLNHLPYRYVINVNNTGSARRTTVRIFMAPKFDDGGRIWQLSDQRKLFIEMDKFVHDLTPGQNTIVRQSTESTVTIPFEQTFRNLSAPVEGDDRRDLRNLEFNFCGCGWPQHMLLPKGTEAGMPFTLFVMLSNYDLDRVEQANVRRELSCKEASSFCGLRDRLYPDRRDMGYPFDRPSRTATRIEDFVTPNMAIQDIVIRHTDASINNPRNAYN